MTLCSGWRPKRGSDWPSSRRTCILHTSNYRVIHSTILVLPWYDQVMVWTWLHHFYSTSLFLLEHLQILHMHSLATIRLYYQYSYMFTHNLVNFLQRKMLYALWGSPSRWASTYASSGWSETCCMIHSLHPNHTNHNDLAKHIESANKCLQPLSHSSMPSFPPNIKPDHQEGVLKNCSD